MDPRSAMETLDHAERLDPLAGRAQRTLDRAFSAGPAGEKARKGLQGDWLGHPLHPALTDLPVGALSTAAVLDAVDAIRPNERLASAVDADILVGLIGAVPTAMAGWADWHRTRHKAVKRSGLVHAALNVATLVLYGNALRHRRKGNKGLGRALLWAGFITLNAGAYLGGHMVYNLGSRVEGKDE